MDWLPLQRIWEYLVPQYRPHTTEVHTTDAGVRAGMPVSIFRMGHKGFAGGRNR